MVTVESGGVRLVAIRAVDADDESVVYAATTDRGEVFADVEAEHNLAEVVAALRLAYEAEGMI